MNAVRRAAAAFDLPGPPAAVRPEPRGHIHDTFVVSYEARGGDVGRAVLQRLAGDVFADLSGLMDNVVRVTAHLRLKARPPRRFPSLIAARDGLAYHVDDDGRWWRAWEFVEGTRSVDTVGSPDEAEQAGRAFGLFVADLADLPGPPLGETIPRFHDLARRADDLRRVASGALVELGPSGRPGPAGAEVDVALALADRVAALLDDTDRLPERAVHNDAKIDNVLFDQRSAAAVCVIDLDTTMAGRVTADFGELVRSGATHAAEDERDLAAVDLDLDLCAALARGYRDGAGAILTRAELDRLPLGGPWLAVENGVRFLTDHLGGDTYYRVVRPGQNLDRARVQLRLASLMLEHLDDLRRTAGSPGGHR